MILGPGLTVSALVEDKGPACSSGHLSQWLLDTQLQQLSRLAQLSRQSQPAPPATAGFRQAGSPHPQGLVLSSGAGRPFEERSLPSHWLQVMLVLL